jgi:hypothetical protein
MGGSSSPSHTTSTVKNEPPDWIKPYSIDLMEQGAATAKRPYTAYSGQRIANLSPEQRSGLTGVVNRTAAGNPAMNAGESMLTNTLSGQYLSPDSNPWLRQNVDTALGQAQGAVSSQFNRPGAFGSSAHEGVASRELGNIAAQMYGQNYMNERANQMNAANQALGYGQADYQDLNALLAAGDTTRQYQQDLLNQQYQDWLEQQNYPLKQLDILGNTIGMSIGNSGTSQTTAPNPYQPNTAANILGGGLSAYGLLNALK